MKEQILKIIDGKSSRIRETYFIKNYAELYNDIMYFCLNISDLPFVQKLWHFCNDQPNYIKCQCGKDVSFNRNWLDGYKYGCSAKCTQSNPLTKKKRKNSTIRKYGVDNISKLEESKSKVEKTNLEKYGTKSSFQNEAVKKKWKDNIKEKYNVDHIFQLDSVKEKSKATNLEKYGKEHYTQTNDYIKKTIEENLKKFGKEWYTQTDEYLIKSKETSNLLYGSDFYIQSDEYKQILLSDERKEQIKKRYFEISKIKYSDSTYELIDRNKSKLTFRDKRDNSIFDILYDCYIMRMQSGYEINTIKNPLNSVKEHHKDILEIHQLLIDNNIEFQSNDRKTISPREIDILIPSHNLCIEYNGLWWHGEFKIDNRNYHYQKTKDCNEKGYRLIHIWSDDYQYKKEIVKSMILNQLGKSKERIYARNCTIKSVNAKDKALFLDNNHIQGTSNSSINYGLYYNDILVSLMTFGYRYINGEKRFELIRFCNKIYTSVIGSANKLFKHFLRNNINIDEVITYCDISHFTGEVYEKMKFKLIDGVVQNYWWVEGDKRKNRFNYTKSKLVNQGFSKDMSEAEIMHSRKFYRVWGSGTQKWVYNL